MVYSNSFISSSHLSLATGHCQLICDPGWRRGPCFGHATLMAEGIEQEGWWKPALSLKASAQMWPLSHPLTGYWPKKNTCLRPTSVGQGCVLPSYTRCCKSQGNRNREWTIAHNIRIYNMPEDGSLASQVFLREDFPKSISSPFAVSTYTKENVEKIFYPAFQPH